MSSFNEAITVKELINLLNGYSPDLKIYCNSPGGYVGIVTNDSLEEGIDPIIDETKNVLYINGE